MNILICGATTYGNMGDDAIRNAIVNNLKNIAGLTLKVTRPYPQKELVEWADKVIIGGGGILYDEGGSLHGQSNFDYYFKCYLKWAIELKKSVCLCGIGVQDLSLKENVDFLREYLKHVSFVSVRHLKDYDFFIKNNLLKENQSSRLILADDLAFQTPKAPFTFTAPTIHKKLCIVPNSRTSYSDLEFLIETLKTHYQLYFAASSYEDVSLVQKLQTCLGFESSVRDFLFLTSNELASFLGEMDLIISNRLHALILGYVGGCKNLFALTNASKPQQQLDPAAWLHDSIQTRDKTTLLQKLQQTNTIKLNQNSSFRHLDLLYKFVNA